jgi:hypothetical protein
MLVSAALMWVAVAALNEPDSAGAAPAAKGPPERQAGPPDPPGRGPSSRPGPSRYRRFSRPLTEEQEQEVLDYLKKKRPELYDQTIESRQKDPRRYQRTMFMIWGWVSRLKKLPENVRDAEERRQAAQLKMYRAARDLQSTKDPAEKKRLEKQLEEQAAVFFDADQIIRGHRLTELAKHIKQLKAELEARAQDRENLIQETVERMKEGAKFYGSGRPPGPPGPPDGDRGKHPRRPPSKPSGERDSK